MGLVIVTVAAVGLSVTFFRHADLYEMGMSAWIAATAGLWLVLHFALQAFNRGLAKLFERRTKR